jgi:hypothetical protein
MIRTITTSIGLSKRATVTVWAVPAALIVATAFLMVFGTGLDLMSLSVLSISISIPFATVGAVIVRRQPRQLVGWLLWAIGSLNALERFLESSGDVMLFGTTLAGRGTAQAIAERFWVPSAFLPVTLLPLLFPTGRQLSHRWRWVGWLAVASMLMIVIPTSTYLWIHRQEFVHNPQIHIPAAIDMTFLVGLIGSLVAGIASSLSVIVRIRRSSGIERQQMKWFFAGAITAFAGLLGLILAPWPDDLNSIAITALPVTIGVAILRYDLYDIDHLINRTLVYSILSAVLAGADLALVVGIQHLFQPVASGSDLVVAGSTLAVAACVQPLRSRIQNLVDRRFYRHKYDAARTLEAFSARLRDEIDLDALLAELGGVVQETMQPTYVSLWLSHGEAN